ncbi:MAG: hypothetical protein K0U47_00295 [Epsilonproteobacteria bacterium]|nr:hypothetical protein [Campylobacterota bacterium]
MTSIEDTKKEMRKYEETRNAFYDHFDNTIKKLENGQFDFSQAQNLDAQEIYELFFKLDYQARKIRGLLIEARDIKVG